MVIYTMRATNAFAWMTLFKNYSRPNKKNQPSQIVTCC